MCCFKQRIHQNRFLPPPQNPGSATGITAFALSICSWNNNRVCSRSYTSDQTGSLRPDHWGDGRLFVLFMLCETFSRRCPVAYFKYRNLHGFARFPGDSTALGIIIVGYVMFLRVQTGWDGLMSCMLWYAVLFFMRPKSGLPLLQLLCITDEYGRIALLSTVLNRWQLRVRMCC